MKGPGLALCSGSEGQLGTQIVPVTSGMGSRDEVTSGHVYLCLVGIRRAGGMARRAFCRGLPGEVLESLTSLTT